MKKRIAVLLLGIVLTAGVVLTGNYGLSDADKMCYERAVKLQEKINEIGFQEFALADYPVAFCDGKRDYVVTPSEPSYRIEKRKPVLDTFVATAYEVNGHYEVIVPTKEMMSELMDVVGIAVNGEAQSGYHEEQQIAAIWHEAFHCWQLSRFEENISAFTGGHSFDEEGYGEELIVKACDGNSEAAALYGEGARLLKEAAEQEDKEEIKTLMSQYKDIWEKRNALLDETVQGLENYYTSVEGSACYVEAMVCREIDGERFEEDYMDSIDFYVNGSSKYYHSGMAQCMILDRLDSTWKAGYDFSRPLIHVIYEKLGLQ
ncbi:MAG: hypothetical protein NC347_05250 [Clostridium sp.]|nr:hypothetical protein [Clostridium sp.]